MERESKREEERNIKKGEKGEKMKRNWDEKGGEESFNQSFKQNYIRKLSDFIEQKDKQAFVFSSRTQNEWFLNYTKVHLQVSKYKQIHPA